MPENIRKWLWCACGVAVSVFLCIALWQGNLFLLSARTQIVDLQPMIRDAHVTVLEAGLTLKNLREASQSWKDATTSQTLMTTRAMSNVAAAAEQLSTFVSKTDTSVNSQLLPTLSQSIREQNSALLSTQAALQANLQDIAKATMQAQQVLVDADKQVSNPAIQESLEHVAHATAEADASLVTVHKGLDYEYKQLTAPVSKVKAAALIAARFAGRFFGF